MAADALGEEEGAEGEAEEDLAEELGGADDGLDGGSASSGHGLYYSSYRVMVVSAILGRGIEKVLEMTRYRSLMAVELAVNVSRGL